MQLIGEALLVIKYALVPALMTFTHVTSDGLQESVHFVPRVLAKCVHLLAQLSHTKSSEQLLAVSSFCLSSSVLFSSKIL